MAEAIGYPVMLKASWGGGGRGMRVIRSAADLAREVTEAKREAKAAFGKDEVYLEKLVERARHVESQILGDTYGNAVHLFERDCSIQRRNQKVVERAPAPYLTEAQRAELAEYSLRIAELSNGSQSCAPIVMSPILSGVGASDKPGAVQGFIRVKAGPLSQWMFLGCSGNLAGG